MLQPVTDVSSRSLSPSPPARPQDAPTARMLDLGALERTPLRREPYDFLVVPGFLRPEHLDAVLRDFPTVDRPGNRALDHLRYGPAFERLLRELQEETLADAFSRKFGVELTRLPTSLRVRGRCEQSDGHIHTDHWTKVVTLLVYPDRSWEPAAGRLRVLRSATDLEDYAEEVVPEGGTLLAFRRSDRSYHGHRRHVGERRLIQMSWNRPSRLARSVQSLTRLGTRALKRVGLHRT